MKKQVIDSAGVPVGILVPDEGGFTGSMTGISNPLRRCIGRSTICWPKRRIRHWRHRETQMVKLRHFLRLSSLHEDLEARLLREEFRSLLLDDHIDDGQQSEIRLRLSDVSRQMSSFR